MKIIFNLLTASALLLFCSGVYAGDQPTAPKPIPQATHGTTLSKTPPRPVSRATDIAKAKAKLRQLGYSTHGPARPFRSLSGGAKSSLLKAFRSDIRRPARIGKFATPTKDPSAMYCHADSGEIGCYSDDGAYFCGCFNLGGGEGWDCHCGENEGTSDD